MARGRRRAGGEVARRGRRGGGERDGARRGEGGKGGRVRARAPGGLDARLAGSTWWELGEEGAKGERSSSLRTSSRSRPLGPTALESLVRSGPAPRQRTQSPYGCAVPASCSSPCRPPADSELPARRSCSSSRHNGRRASCAAESSSFGLCGRVAALEASQPATVPRTLLRLALSQLAFLSLDAHESRSPSSAGSQCLLHSLGHPLLLEPDPVVLGCALCARERDDEAAVGRVDRALGLLEVLEDPSGHAAEDNVVGEVALDDAAGGDGAVCAQAREGGGWTQSVSESRNPSAVSEDVLAPILAGPMILTPPPIQVLSPICVAREEEGGKAARGSALGPCLVWRSRLLVTGLVLRKERDREDCSSPRQGTRARSRRSARPSGSSESRSRCARPGRGGRPCRKRSWRSRGRRSQSWRRSCWRTGRVSDGCLRGSPVGVADEQDEEESTHSPLNSMLYP